MKKTVKWIMIALAACAIALAGCKVVSEPEPIAVQSVTINGSSTLTLEFGETRTLTATVYPYNADDKTVTWSSSNTDAVGVNCFNGTITANNVGTSIITAQAGGCMATCEVTVKPQVVGVNYVTLNETTITLEPNARHILTATVHPDNADDKSVTWSSSNPDVARVYSDGVSDGMVVAISTGSATITAHVGECTASCAVYVNETAVEQPDSPIAVESITLNTSTLMLEPNTTSTLTATVTPSNADYTYISWSSSDTSIAYVDFYGNVMTYSEGMATITAQAGDKTATCEITVKHIANPVTGVTIDKETLTLMPDEEYTLTATVTPSNADYKSVTWTSSDWEVADVHCWDGTVTARKMGTATITATTEEGGFTATCEVTVLPLIPVESITLKETTLLLACGDECYLVAKVTPDDADDKTIIWSSSDETIATVDIRGPNLADITAHNVGKTAITATALAGGKTAECIVTVHEHSYRDGKCIVCEANPKIKDGTIDENGVLTKYDARNTNPVIIPEGVTGIGASAFYNSYSNQYLTSVTIPDSVKNIGDKAFYSCWKLTSVTIGNGVTSIGESAFSNCGITSVTIPNSVTSIGDSAFEKCSITSVTIPNSVKSIGSKVFYSCWYLKNVTIPDGVTSIGSSAFSYCTRLESVAIPNSVTSIGSSAFSYCTNLTKIQFNGTKAQWNAIKGSGNVDITCILCSDGYIGVKDVPTYLKMSGRTVTGYTDTVPASLVIPDGVTGIEDRAFKDCTSLTSVTIPSSVKSIGDYAFEGCTSLASVTISTGVKSIGNSAFGGCTSLTSVAIPYGVTSIGTGAFKGCTSLTSVTIPASITKIATEMFMNCTELNEITIPDSVTSIGVRAFCDTYLTGIDIPNSVTRIESNAFSGCEFLLSIKIPDSVTYIGPCAFSSCTNLRSVVISANVTSIDMRTFYNCTNLTELTIPTSVTYIGEYAFLDCTSLKTVYYGGTKNEWGNIDRYKHPNNGFYGDSLSGKEIIGKDADGNEVKWTVP